MFPSAHTAIMLVLAAMLPAGVFGQVDSVRGKPYFGDDPTLALRNLPAEVIDKIQVFDQMSDQAQFTGFDDGQAVKALNIQTRRSGEIWNLARLQAVLETIATRRSEETQVPLKGTEGSPSLDYPMTSTSRISRRRICSAGLKWTWTFWKGVVLRNDVSNALTSGLSSGFNQNIVLWNISFAQKVFENRNGEIKLGVADLLGQNKSVSRAVTDTYVEDTRNEALPRYVMASFTYTFR